MIVGGWLGEVGYLVVGNFVLVSVVLIEGKFGSSLLVCCWWGNWGVGLSAGVCALPRFPGRLGWIASDGVLANGPCSTGASTGTRVD